MKKDLCCAAMQKGFATQFEINISLESDEEISEIKQLIQLAHRLCFAEKSRVRQSAHSLNPTLEWTTSHHLGIKKYLRL